METTDDLSEVFDVVDREYEESYNVRSSLRAIAAAESNLQKVIFCCGETNWLSSKCD